MIDELELCGLVGVNLALVEGVRRVSKRFVHALVLGEFVAEGNFVFALDHFEQGVGGDVWHFHGVPRGNIGDGTVDGGFKGSGFLLCLRQRGKVGFAKGGEFLLCGIPMAVMPLTVFDAVRVHIGEIQNMAFGVGIAHVRAVGEGQTEAECRVIVVIGYGDFLAVNQ